MVIDEDSGESTQQEDDESETAETDELDGEEVILTDEQMERRTYVYYLCKFA